MKTAEKIAPRVLMVALLAMVALVARPGMSLAQSAFQVVPQEGDYTYHFDTEPELRTTNATAGPLCANYYVYDTYGDIICCVAGIVYPANSVDSDFQEDSGLDEGSIFIVSGAQPPNNGNCNPMNPKPKAGLRSWLMVDDEGAVGVNAQDAMVSADVLGKLIMDCSYANQCNTEGLYQPNN